MKRYLKALSAVQWFAAVFAVALLALYPLYIHDYFNLDQTKFYCFVCISFVFMEVILVAGAVYLVGVPELNLKRPSLSALSILPFFVVTFLATVFSLATGDSLYGRSGYLGGLAMAAILCVLYPAVALGFSAKDANLVRVIAAVCAVLAGGLYALNAFNIDPLGIVSLISAQQMGEYLGSLGQVDFNGSYMALAIPPVWAGYIMAADKRSSVGWGVLSLLLAAVPAVYEADGLFIALAVVCAAVMCGPAFNTRRLGRLCFVWAAVFLWSEVFECLRLAGVPFIAQTPVVALFGAFSFVPALLLAAAGALLACWRSKKGERSLTLFGRIVVGTAVALVVLLLILRNAVPGFPSLGRQLDNFFLLNAHWGTDRGLAWGELWGIFCRASIGRKLIGFGPGTTHEVLCELSVGTDEGLTHFYAAHNELLEQLIGTGLLGLAAWLLVVVSHLRLAYAHRQQPAAAAWGLGFLGYFAQSLISIRVAPVFVMAFLYLPLLSAVCRPENKPEPDAGPAAVKPEKALLRGVSVLAAALVLMRIGYWLSHLWFASQLA